MTTSPPSSSSIWAGQMTQNIGAEVLVYVFNEGNVVVYVYTDHAPILGQLRPDITVPADWA